MRLFGFDITRARSDDLVVETRSDEVSGLENPKPWLLDALSAHPVAAGVTVTEETAMRVAAVFACVRVLSGAVSSLPFRLYRRSDTGRVADRDHYLNHTVLDSPNALMTPMQLMELMMVHIALWGNAYMEPQSDRGGRVISLWPINPARVHPHLDNKGPYGTPRRRYQVTGVPGYLSNDQIIHVAGLGFDGFVGKGPVRLLREGIGTVIAAERYGGKFFANDTRSGMYLKTDQQLGDDVYDRLRDQWAKYEGTEQAWKTKILEAGLSIDTVGLPPGDAQFIETRKYGRSEIAGVFGVPPHMIGDVERSTSWGTGIEQQSIGFVKHTLNPYLVRIEESLTRSLLTAEERKKGYYFEFTVEGLLRGDTAARQQWYSAMRQWGVYSVNDIRALENMEPIEGGDIYLQPINMISAGTDPFSNRFSEDRALSEARTLPERRSVPPARYRLAHAFETVYEETFVRVVKREINQIRTAIAQYLGQGDVQGFRDWLVETFSEEMTVWMGRQVVGVFQSMADTMIDAAREELGVDIQAGELGDFILNYVSGFTARHVGSTQGQLLEILNDGGSEEDLEQRLDEWDERRAGKDAHTEMVRSSNAFTLAAWIVAGVAAMRWTTFGENCPYCDALDGKEVRITGAFANEGDQIGDMPINRRTAHPPLHRGCDCYLNPVSGRRQQLTDAERRSALQALIPTTDSPTRTGHFVDANKMVGGLDVRDQEIRDIYPALRRELGSIQAIAELADRHALSERQVRRVIWEKGRS